MCSCKNGEQTVDHILFDCKLLDQERDSLKAAVLRSENWPVSKNKLVTKFNKNFTKFMKQCIFRNIIKNNNNVAVNSTILHIEQVVLVDIM